MTQFLGTLHWNKNPLNLQQNSVQNEEKIKSLVSFRILPPSLATYPHKRTILEVNSWSS